MEAIRGFGVAPRLNLSSTCCLSGLCSSASSLCNWLFIFFGLHVSFCCSRCVFLNKIRIEIFNLACASQIAAWKFCEQCFACDNYHVESRHLDLVSESTSLAKILDLAHTVIFVHYHLSMVLLVPFHALPLCNSEILMFVSFVLNSPLVPLLATVVFSTFIVRWSNALTFIYFLIVFHGLTCSSSRHQHTTLIYF